LVGHPFCNLCRSINARESDRCARYLLPDALPAKMGISSTINSASLTTASQSLTAKVKFDGYMLIGTFRGKPQSLSGRL